MSTTRLINFLKALDAVKQGYTCAVCSELCSEPVILSICFHIICAKHFEDLKTCPTCKVSLEGCTTFTDDRLKSCINSAKELDVKLEDVRKDLQPAITTPVSAAVSRKKRDKKQPDKKEHDKNKDTTSKKSKKLKLKEKENENKADLDEATNMKSEYNTSLVSNISSKFNKSVEKRNIQGETMFHIACRLGKLDKANELLNQGANPNTKDNAGWTPLHEVVQNGQLELIQLLLKHNALVNVPGQGNETPLHEAVRYNHKEIAVELIKNGADINARNIKGETPLELANEDMKLLLLNATENIVQSQSVNVTRVSNLQSSLDYNDIRVYCVTEFRTVYNKIKTLIKHHNNLHIEQKFTKKVTHLIVDTDDDRICNSTLDVLQGIVYGIWILSSQWVTKSTNDKLEPFENYEVMGVGNKSYNGPKNSRYNKYKQLPGLFNGCHMYLHNFNTKYEISKTIIITKTIISKLITDAGGVVLRRVPNPETIPESEKMVPYHAKKDGELVSCSHYIIFKDMYQPMYNMQHLKALPIGWLIECLEKYELCEPWPL